MRVPSAVEVTKKKKVAFGVHSASINKIQLITLVDIKNGINLHWKQSNTSVIVIALIPKCSIV